MRKVRSPASYRRKLLQAIRYPWPPVAWHAAETLIAVNDTEAVPELTELLHAPDPAKPHPDSSGRMVVEELVRINHLQNCLLCHAPSRDKNDLFVASVPASPASTSSYQGNRPSIRRIFDALVRVDVIFLRQDFSVVHRQTSPISPQDQRFDYLVRTREASAEEIAATERMSAEERLQSPQREAILFALKKLANENSGF